MLASCAKICNGKNLDCKLSKFAQSLSFATKSERDKLQTNTCITRFDSDKVFNFFPSLVQHTSYCMVFYNSEPTQKYSKSRQKRAKLHIVRRKQYTARSGSVPVLA